MVYKSTKDVVLKDTCILTVNLEKAKAIIPENCDLNIGEVKVNDLKKEMDEVTLAREAIDLNVKLMKWREVENLDIEKIRSSKILMFGAGTLGC